MKNQIEILIVDDSETARMLLTHIIESDPALKVAGYASSSQEALEWLQIQTPDVITMDIFMPKVNGYETTRKIMETKPLPIVIISSAYNEYNTELSFKAIEAGALAILKKPVGSASPGYEREAKEIISTIKTIAAIKCIKRSPLRIPSLKIETIPNKIEAIAIGASLGGPVALEEILSNLTVPFPFPIYIVQHITSGFTEGLAKWLNESSKIPITIARHGEQAQANHVYLAPDENQMEIASGGIISITPTKGIQPSIDRLFHTAANTYRSRVVGIILTGMGRDGSSELLYMKQQGGYTIAQDKESSVIFGMPKEAIELNAAMQILSLDQIAQFLNNLAKK